MCVCACVCVCVCVNVCTCISFWAFLQILVYNEIRWYSGKTPWMIQMI